MTSSRKRPLTIRILGGRLLKVRPFLKCAFYFFSVAMDSAKLWIIDRSVFQMIMMRTGMMRQAEHIAFLKR